MWQLINDVLDESGTASRRQRSLLFHIAWCQSRSGTSRLDSGERSLFGFTNYDELAELLRSRTGRRGARLLQDCQQYAIANGLSFDAVLKKRDLLVAMLQSMLEQPEYDVFATRLAVMRLREMPAWRAFSANSEISYEEEFAFWTQTWRQANNAEEISAGIDVLKTEEYFRDLAAGADERLEATEKESQPVTLAPDGVIEKLREFVAQRPYSVAAALPALFTVAMPLLFAWFGPGDSGQSVPSSFPGTVRLFLFLYLAVPFLLVAEIALRRGLLSLLLFIASACAVVFYASKMGSWTVPILGLEFVAWATWIAYDVRRSNAGLRKVHPRHERVGTAALGAFVLAAGSIAVAGSSSAFDDAFTKIPDVSLNALRLASSIPKFSHSRSMVAARVAIGDVHAWPLDRRPALLTHLNDGYSRRHEAALATLDHLSVLRDPGLEDPGAVALIHNAFLAHAETRLQRLQSAQDSLVAVLAWQPADTATGHRFQRRFSAADFYLGQQAKEAFDSAIERTQRVWASILEGQRIAGLVCFLAVIVALVLWILNAPDGERKAPLLALSAFVAMTLPLVRPVNPAELDPIHPFRTFVLSSWSVAGAVSSVLPHHSPDQDAVVVETFPLSEPTPPAAPPVNLTPVLDELGRLRSTVEQVKISADSAVGLGTSVYHRTVSLPR